MYLEVWEKVCYEELKIFNNSLVLGEEQKSMIEALCAGKDGQYCVQPTGRVSNTLYICRINCYILKIKYKSGSKNPLQV